MTNNAMNQAVARGIRRGIYLSATGDTTRLKELREKVGQTDHTAVAWTKTAAAMRWSMNQASRENSSE